MHQALACHFERDKAMTFLFNRLAQAMNLHKGDLGPHGQPLSVILCQRMVAPKAQWTHAPQVLMQAIALLQPAHHQSQVHCQLVNRKLWQP